MKVAFILHSTSPLTGSSKAFLFLADALQERGVEVCVVMPDKKGIYTTLQEQGLQVLVLTYRACAYTYLSNLRDVLLFIPRMVARIMVNARATRRLATWLVAQKVDIVHTNVGVVRIGFDAARLAGIPHVYHIREYADKCGIYYFPTRNSFLRQLSKPRSYNICITRQVQAYYSQKGSSSSIVIYDPACTGRKSLPEVERKPFFLFAGRVEPLKGLDFLISAYATYVQVVSNPLPLWVAGEYRFPSYFARVKKMIHEMNLDAYILFLGARSDVESLMQQARALIVSSTFEGFGFCMPEAMINGCLVLGRNTSGTKEQMDNGLVHAGGEIALRFDTPASLAGHLQAVTERPLSDFSSYVHRAFDTVNALYTPQPSASAVYRFYQQILSH